MLLLSQQLRQKTINYLLMKRTSFYRYLMHFKYYGVMDKSTSTLTFRPVIFILSLAACFSAAVLGSIFTADAIPGWYATLQKPAFNPPNWLFGPVWTLLYALQAVSLYILWVRKYKGKAELLTLFGIQLGINALWSVVFFGWHSPEAALVVIAALLGLIFHIIQKSRKISKIASNILWPYLAWVSFATLLNIAIAILN